MTGGEVEFGAVLLLCPFEHSFPERGADTLTADGFICDEIFEIGCFADDGAHNDGEGGDADDFAVVVDSEKHIVAIGVDEIFKPLFGDFAAVFAAARELD